MNPLDYIKTLDHHAYFIHSIEDTFHKLKEFLKDKFGISHHQNPDFLYQKFEIFGIDESRHLIDLHSSKSFSSESKRIFIIECSNITHEAQNSLLKIFEEPHEQTYFFLVMPSYEVLLPTLQSRLHISKKIEQENYLKDAEEFLKLSKKDKVNFVDELVKRISDEKAEKSDAQKFLASLEIVLYKKQGLSAEKGLKAILKARDFMNDRSPSIKQLLEYVALNV